MRFLKSKLFVVNTEDLPESTPFDFIVRFPSKLLTCAEGEVMRLSLEQWEFNTTWPTHTGLWIEILDIMIVFDDGNYTMVQIAKHIETDYNSSKNPIDPNLTVSFSNFRFTLTFDGLIGSVNVSPTLAKIMGLDESYENITLIETVNEIRPRPIDNLTIAFEGVSPKNYTYRTDTTGQLLPYNDLTSVPIDVAPYTRCVWRSVKDGDASKYLQERHIESIRFKVYAGTDTSDLATFFPKSVLHFKVSWYEEDELAVSREADRMMVEYLKLMFIQSGIGKE
jgi:hypothetical protein